MIVLVVLALIVALVLAFVIVGLVFKLLWWALVGLVIGAIARAILPGRQQISLLATAVAGIAGSLFGGIIAHAFHWGGVIQFLVAIAVAAVVILALTARRPTRAF